MQNLRNTVLSYVRVGNPVKGHFVPHGLKERNGPLQLLRACSTATTSVNQDQIMDRVISLVKKFDNVDSNKVTEKADFQKDLSLDSLDRVELVMAFEEEFSVEIPDEEADKLKTCADVAKYVISRADEKVSGESQLFFLGILLSSYSPQLLGGVPFIFTCGMMFMEIFMLFEHD